MLVLGMFSGACAGLLDVFWGIIERHFGRFFGAICPMRVVLGGKSAHLRPTLEPGDEISAICGVAFGSCFCMFLLRGPYFVCF